MTLLLNNLQERAIGEQSGCKQVSASVYQVHPIVFIKNMIKYNRNALPDWTEQRVRKRDCTLEAARFTNFYRTCQWCLRDSAVQQKVVLFFREFDHSDE